MCGLTFKTGGSVGVVVVVTGGTATLSMQAPSELRGIGLPPSVVGSAAICWMALAKDLKALVLDGFLKVSMGSISSVCTLLICCSCEKFGSISCCGNRANEHDTRYALVCGT